MIRSASHPQSVLLSAALSLALATSGVAQTTTRTAAPAREDTSRTRVAHALPAGDQCASCSLAASDLPDAPPAFSLPSRVDAATVQSPGSRFSWAPRHANTIEPGYAAQTLNATGKIQLAVSAFYSWHYLAGTLTAAGISHGANSAPKYGTDDAAFAQRLGAAAARQGSQILFSKALLAPMLHEDTRYYVRGSGHRVLSRVFYAATRVVVTRSDSGGPTLNIAELAGYGGSSALTQLYYPNGGRDAGTMLSGYGVSLGGLAIQNEMAEFARFLVRGQPK